MRGGARVRVCDCIHVSFYVLGWRTAPVLPECRQAAQREALCVCACVCVRERERERLCVCVSGHPATRPVCETH